MNTNGYKATVQMGMIVVFWALLAGFLLNLWGVYEPSPPPLTTSSQHTNITTVRLSTAQLVAMDEDVSGTDCYSCHEEGETGEVPVDENGNVVLPEDHRDLIYSRLNCVSCHDPEEDAVEIEWDDDGNIIIPQAHTNLVLRHGQYSRNNNCFNCHASTNYTVLLSRSGETYPLTESTHICAACHGTTYRDWQEGIHGRWNGYWQASAGERQFTPCAACHDPHSPRFISMKPSPSPYRLNVAQANHGSDSGNHDTPDKEEDEDSTTEPASDHASSEE